MMRGADDPQNFTHWFTHRLGVALRFVDVFTAEPIEAALRVTVPAEGWRSLRRTSDATYRFLLTEEPLPTGTFDVAVEDPEGQYVSHLPVRFTLPRPHTLPPPPMNRSDFLLQFPLWPMRRTQVAPQETAVVGRVVSAGDADVSDLDIWLFEAGTAPTPEQFARTNQEGQFLFRLPWLSPRMSGRTVTPPPFVEVRIARAGAVISPVMPATFGPVVGQIETRAFHIP